LQTAPAKRRWGGGCWDEEQLRAIRHDTIGISGEELALKDADKFRTPWKQLQRSGGKKAAVGIDMESCHHGHQHWYYMTLPLHTWRQPESSKAVVTGGLGAAVGIEKQRA